MLIIDADSIPFICSKEDIRESIDLVDSLINSLYEEFKDENGELKMYFVLSEPPYFRKKIYEGYKSKRKSPSLLWIKTLKSYLKERYKAFSIPLLEADDVVSFLKNEFPEATLCSIDKDVLLQNKGKHFNYKKLEYVEVKTLFEATKFIFKQVLMGDSADDIPGLPGIGDKKSDNILEKCTTFTELLGTVKAKYLEVYKDVKVADEMIDINFKLVHILKTKESIESALQVPFGMENVPERFYMNYELKQQIPHTIDSNF